MSLDDLLEKILTIGSLVILFTPLVRSYNRLLNDMRSFNSKISGLERKVWNIEGFLHSKFQYHIRNGSDEPNPH